MCSDGLFDMHRDMSTDRWLDLAGGCHRFRRVRQHLFCIPFLAAYCNAHDNYHIATSVATISRRNIDARIDAAISTTIDAIISISYGILVMAIWRSLVRLS